MELRLPAIKGIGGAPLYLIDRYEDGQSIYDIDFQFLDGVDRHPRGCGFKLIDHLTHNVYRGRMEYWAGFYERIFNFHEIRYFDIKGEYTGLLSKAMTAPDGKIRIPLNEEGTACHLLRNAGRPPSRAWRAGWGTPGSRYPAGRLDCRRRSAAFAADFFPDPGRAGVL
jgi:4-hydroxyphenylpyruvate dioxygenase-like putative hemolysin